MTSARQEGIARNEAEVRNRNESGAWPVAGGRLAYLCECGDRDCFRRVELTRDEYLTVRADARRFAVLPGHEIPDAETVVESHDRYVVVEKDEDVARRALSGD